MNRVVLLGRLTRDPDVRHVQGANGDMAIARFNLAVDRRRRKDSNEQQADFINCVAFGKIGEFAEKYLRKGTKIAIDGRIQTGSYDNKDGMRIYTTDVVIEHCEFAESKKSGNAANGTAMGVNGPDGFMNIPDGIDEELPFQ